MPRIRSHTCIPPEPDDAVTARIYGRGGVGTHATSDATLHSKRRGRTSNLGGNATVSISAFCAALECAAVASSASSCGDTSTNWQVHDEPLHCGHPTHRCVGDGSSVEFRSRFAWKGGFKLAGIARYVCVHRTGRHDVDADQIRGVVQRQVARHSLNTCLRCRCNVRVACQLHHPSGWCKDHSP